MARKAPEAVYEMTDEQVRQWRDDPYGDECCDDPFCECYDG